MRQNFVILKVALILSLGAFAMGNAKVSMSLLIPMMAEDLQTTEYLVLNSMWAYFIGAIIGGPILALLMRNGPKHRNLIVLSIWCFLGNVLTSLSPNIDWLLWLRFFCGLPHGAFMTFAILYLAQMAPSEHRSGYIALVMMGGAVATVFAAPLNGWIADQYSWQTAFRFVALADLLLAILVHDLLPKIESNVSQKTIKEQLQGLLNVPLWLLLFIEVLVMSIVSAIWTSAYAVLYEQPIDVSLNYPVMIGIGLGLGFLGGQAIGAYWAYRNAHQGIAVTCVWALFGCVLLWQTMDNLYISLIGLACLSSLTMINIVLQIRLLQVEANNLYLVFCLFHSALHVGNVLGSLGGYKLLSDGGFNGVLFGCAVLALMGLLAWGVLHRLYSLSAAKV